VCYWVKVFKSLEIQKGKHINIPSEQRKLCIHLKNKFSMKFRFNSIFICFCLGRLSNSWQGFIPMDAHYPIRPDNQRPNEKSGSTQLQDANGIVNEPSRILRIYTFAPFLALSPTNIFNATK